MPAPPRTPWYLRPVEERAMGFAEKLRALRTEKSWSQTDLAKRTGLTKLMVSKYETGRSNPSLENLGSIARALGVATDYLIFDDVPREGRTEVRDVALFERCQQAQALDDESRRTLTNVIDALLARREMDEFLERQAHRRAAGDE